jgi:hypothetical protein
VVRELLTRDDYWNAILGGDGVVVVVDKYTGRRAHPVSCPTLEAAHFVEKVITNGRRNGSYYWAASTVEARRDLDAQPCQCP